MTQIRIKIRPIRLADTNDIHEVMHMPNVLWGTSLLPSTTVDEWHKIIEEWVHDEQMHIFVADIQEKAVGIISLHVGKGRERHVGDIAMAVHDKYQGQGIGKMLMLTILDLADNWLNLVRLELDVYTDNERAIHIYRNFNFEIEGRKRFDACRLGNYIDSYIMARVHLPNNSNLQIAYEETLMRVPVSTVPPGTSPSEGLPETKQ